MNKNKMSVLVTTYNHKLFIRDCIDSILKQDIDENFIIRVVDDFSEDGTRDILSEYQAVFPERIHLYLNPINFGQNAMIPFAKALRETESKYLAFCDGDDYWLDRGKLRKQSAILEENPKIGIVHSDYLQETSYRGHTAHTQRTEKEISKAKKMRYGKDLIQGNDIKHSTAVIRSEALDYEFILGAQGILALDWIMYVSVASDFEISYLPEVTTIHRIHTGGVWNGSKREERDDMKIKVREYCARKLPNFRLRSSFKMRVISDRLRIKIRVTMLYRLVRPLVIFIREKILK